MEVTDITVIKNLDHYTALYRDSSVMRASARAAEAGGGTHTSLCTSGAHTRLC